MNKYWCTFGCGMVDSGRFSTLTTTILIRLTDGMACLRFSSRPKPNAVKRRVSRCVPGLKRPAVLRRLPFMSDERRSIQAVVDELNALDSADRVAQMLITLGIKGQRSTPSKCPITRYFQQETGDLTISSGYHTLSGVDTKVFHLANHVSNFIELFDFGSYSELLETTEEPANA